MQSIAQQETGLYHVFWTAETAVGRFFIELKSTRHTSHWVTVFDATRENCVRARSSNDVKEALFECLRKLDIKVLQWRQEAYESNIKSQKEERPTSPHQEQS